MERGSKQTPDVGSHTRGKYQLGCVHRQSPPRVVTERTQTGEIQRQIKQSKLISNRFKATRQCRTLKNSVVGRDRLPAQTQFGNEDGSPHVTTQTVIIVERCTDSGVKRTLCLVEGDRSLV